MSLQKIKKTTYIALTLLLVCTVMLGAVSYAWLSLSRAPEISGIETNIGSNGSLEIALLTESTFIDPTTIKTKVGSSLEEQDAVISNLSWGNVIDLDDSAYGLGSIALVPARLDVTDALVVNSGLLKVPGYGADGRFTEFSNDTASGIYSVDQFGVGSFSFSTAGQGYGVRGIGKLAGVSAQESALATSRTAVRAYGNAAESDILTIWEDNGPGLLEIMHYLYGGKQGELDFEQALLLMKNTAQRLLVIYDYLDSALRQGIIGYASLMVGDAEEFKMIKQNLENEQIPLTVLLDMIPLTGPFHYEATARVIEDDVAQLNRLIAACDEGFDRSLLPSMFDILVETDDAYINDTQVRNWQARGVDLTEDNILTLYAGHHGNGGYVYGTLHRVVQFVGEYHAFFQYAGVSVEVTTVLDPTLSPVIDTVYGILEQTDDSNDEDYIEVTPLDDVCGFAVDMAFRCNQDSDLLLQTMPEVRIEGDEYPELNNTQGGGSFMRFQSEELTTEQMVHLVDALRIGFMDNQNKLIAVAKLNTSNYQETEDGVTAPLYLYDFTAYADGRIEIGERRSENSAVTSLSQDKEKVISVVVWLDGDYIDNSHASIVNNSMTGTLNLQFSSSADLKPALPGGSENPDTTVPGEELGSVSGLRFELVDNQVGIVFDYPHGISEPSDSILYDVSLKNYSTNKIYTNQCRNNSILLTQYSHLLPGIYDYFEVASKIEEQNGYEIVSAIDFNNLELIVLEQDSTDESMYIRIDPSSEVSNYAYTYMISGLTPNTPFILYTASERSAFGTGEGPLYLSTTVGMSDESGNITADLHTWDTLMQLKDNPDEQGAELTKLFFKVVEYTNPYVSDDRLSASCTLNVRYDWTHYVPGGVGIDTEQKGTYSDSIIWSFTEGSVLEISGVGVMPTSNNGTYPWTGLRGRVKKLILDDGITTVADKAFRNFVSLETILLSDDILIIGDSAFSGVERVSSLEIPEGVTEIGSAAFSGCTKLNMITLPSRIVCIPYAAFQGCSSLTDLVVPSGVTSIEQWAFAWSGLETVTIPGSVSSIGYQAFQGVDVVNYVGTKEMWERISGSEYVKHAIINYIPY